MLDCDIYPRRIVQGNTVNDVVSNDARNMHIAKGKESDKAD